MIISIGSDCHIAMFLKNNNLKSYSFPFDWIVTYNGVSKCIENDFNNFIPKLLNRINEYDMFFYHDFDRSNVYDHIDKYNRRIERFKNILETTTEEITFCRKGHCTHHHDEHNGTYKNITNDIEDIYNLDDILKKKYPKLNYKIILILVCGRCFYSTKKYESIRENISIYNIAMINMDYTLFDNYLRTLFIK
jgi:hypothetical protein